MTREDAAARPSGAVDARAPSADATRAAPRGDGRGLGARTRARRARGPAKARPSSATRPHLACSSVARSNSREDVDAAFGERAT